MTEPEVQSQQEMLNKSKQKKVKEKILHEEKFETNILSEYIFSFELSKPYPSLRSYIVKRPLKKSMKDTFFELFDGGRSLKN